MSSFETTFRCVLTNVMGVLDLQKMCRRDTDGTLDRTQLSRVLLSVAERLTCCRMQIDTTEADEEINGNNMRK